MSAGQPPVAARHRIVPLTPAPAVQPLPPVMAIAPVTFSTGATSTGVWRDGQVTVYVTIGNTDGRLSHPEWVALVVETRGALRAAASAGRVHGDWHSAPDALWVNHCWCAEMARDQVAWLRDRLRQFAVFYRQDAIALAVLPGVEHVRPGP